MPPGDPHGWEAQRAQIIAGQQRAQQAQEDWFRAGGALAAARAAATGGYGAIAFAAGAGRWGWSWGQLDQVTAERVAIQKCAAAGGVVLCWGNDFYLALAVGESGAYGAGWAASARRARKLALANIGTRARNPRLVLCFHTRTGS